jgi:hypothetical protein
MPAAQDAWLVAERARLGLAVEWEALLAVVTLEDARALGVVPGASSATGDGSFGWFGPFQAYLALGTGLSRDVRFRAASLPVGPVALEPAADDQDPRSWGIDVRIGRQAIEWGDGRLIGRSDWAHRGHSFDAARLRAEIGDFDLEAFGALLAVPGALPTELVDADETTSSPADARESFGTGAQLYGARAIWHALPLLRVELAALARVVRQPLEAELTPSDTVVIDGRLFGDERGFRYAAEGAYETGRVASYGVVRDVSAFAFSGWAAWLTALPWNFEFGVRGGYASGQGDSAADATVTRFDPIAPEIHEGRAVMGLAAWSNQIEAGAFVGARPFDAGAFRLGFTFLGLAEPTDRWITGTLVPVGAEPSNASRVLGYELDAELGISPWDPLRFDAGYGLMLLGEGGRSVLASAGRGEHDLAHVAFLQAALRAP